MQQIFKWAGGGQPFLEQGQGVLFLTEAQNVGFTVEAKFEIQTRSNRGTPFPN
jgi:hypothetical protein